MDKYSLLIVDDEEKARRHMMENIHWEHLDIGPIYEAADGRMAMEMLQRYEPDLMILDIRMPKLDGVGLLELLMGDPGNQNNPKHGRIGWLRGYQPMVITLSGYSDFEAARKMLSSGIVVEYLLKPASEDQIFEAVYKCIEHIDLRRGLQENMAAAREDEAEIAETTVSPDHGATAGKAPGESNISKTQIAVIQAVKDYIHSEYSQKLTLKMAAEKVFMNPSYLSHLFAEVEGMGFSDYLCQIRMEKAKELLQDYHWKIYEVADAVGYQDVKHFMKVFKKQVGQTPSEYREHSLLSF